MFSLSQPAAFSASVRYLSLKPISIPSPLPSHRQTSSALPMGVTQRQSMLPSLKVMRTGLEFFTLTMRATRSMVLISSLLPTSTV